MSSSRRTAIRERIIKSSLALEAAADTPADAPLDTSVAGVPSPCVQVCSLNEFDVCYGCRRSLDEIVGWARMSNEQKRAVLVALSSRIV